MFKVFTLVVWDTENPKLSSNSAINFFIRVDFPLPDGPQRTNGLKFPDILAINISFLISV